MEVPITIIKCDYRNDIDQMLLDGVSYTRIVKWLKDRGVGMSRNTISKYHKNCFDVEGKAVSIYLDNQEKSEEVFNDAVEKQIGIIELYDKLIAAGINTNIDLLDPKGKIDAALKAAKQKQDLMDRSGEEYDQEKTELLRAIRELLINPGVRESLAGIKSRRKFTDPTPD